MKSLISLTVISLFLGACAICTPSKREANIETVNLTDARVIEHEGSKIYALDNLVVVDVMGDLVDENKWAEVHLGSLKSRAVAIKQNGAGLYAFDDGELILDEKQSSDKNQLLSQLRPVMGLPDSKIGFLIDKRINTAVVNQGQLDITLGGIFCDTCGGNCRKSTCLPPVGPVPVPEVFSEAGWSKLLEVLRNLETISANQ